MKKAGIIPLIALFSVLLASCKFPDPSVEETDDSEEGFFYARYMTANAQNLPDNGFYKVKAEKLWAGAKCEIWAETDSGVTKAEAEKIAREYEGNIRPCIIDAFSEKNFTYSFDDIEYSFENMLDFANWLTGRDSGKLTILLLDIRDGFQGETSDSYVAGYFYSGNFAPVGDNNYYSNGRDMIYVDTNPGLKEYATQAYATFAHELQHLVNFVTCVWLNKGLTDIWVNEGLSSYAEYLYLGEHPDDKIAWLGDRRNTISTGNNFFVWGNHSDKPLAILDDYTTAYLFFRWLYLQADAVPGLPSRIFRDIAHSGHSDYRAVTSVAALIDPSWNSWEVLLRSWLIANYFPYSSNGYTDDAELQKALKIAPAAGNSIALYPGEGVYSIINDPYSAVNTGKIRYVQLDSDTGKVLLTFNANENNKAEHETGFLTGFSASVTASQTAAENARSGKRVRPYVVDAQDMLGRDQDKPIRVWR